MRRRLLEIGRLVEPGRVALEHLVGADDEGARPAPGYLLRFQLGEGFGDLPNGGAFRLESRLDLGFVDV